MLEDVPIQEVDLDEFDRDIREREELEDYLQWLVNIGVDISLFKEEMNDVTSLQSDLEYFDQRLRDNEIQTNEDFKEFCDKALFEFYDELNKAGNGAEFLHEKFEQHRQNMKQASRNNNFDKAESIKYRIYQTVNRVLLGNLLPQVLLNLDKEERKIEEYLDASILHLNHKSNKSPSQPNFDEILGICSFYAPESEGEDLMKLKRDLKNYLR